jgi:hypothetical protein
MSAVLKAQNEDINEDTDVWVFARDEELNVTSPGARITVKKYLANRPLTDIIITGQDTVMSGDGSPDSGRSFTLNTIKVPSNALEILNLTWYLKDGNDFDTALNVPSTIATITPGSDTTTATFKATDDPVNSNIEVWVFVSDADTGIRSTGHKVEIIPPGSWTTIWEFNSNTVTSTIRITTGTSARSGVPERTLGSASGNLDITSNGIILAGGNNRLLIGQTSGNTGTNSSTALSTGEFNIGQQGELRITIQYEKTTPQSINLFINNNTNNTLFSVHSDFNKSHTAVAIDTLQTAVFEYDLAVMAGSNVNAASYTALNNTFFQLHSPQATTTIKTIRIEKK